MASPTPGPLWRRMHAQPRHRPSDLVPSDIPLEPGVYAWYRRGRPIYVGKANSLRTRLGKHLGRGKVMGSSAFRRNVAENLGIASANAIYKGEYEPTLADLARVRCFIESCQLAWITVTTKRAAKLLEDDFKAEWTPRLTKR